MNCNGARRMISLYVDGELKGNGEERLLAHLRSCLKCREEMNFMSEILKELPARKIPEVSPYFFARVREKITQGKEAGPIFFPLNLKPAFLGVRLFVVMIIFSALAGIFLGDTYWTHANNSQLSSEEAKSSFNLGVFEDTPDGSMGDFHNEVLGGA